METGAITSYIDVAQLVLYAFWIFFAGLIIYLHRENKREGYPLETTRERRIRTVGYPDMPAPKTYRMPHGGGTRTAPKQDPAPYDLAAEPTSAAPGSPLHPTGDPLADGVGPAAWATRPDVPDLTHEGEPRIVPMRVAADYTVETRDPDPRGQAVYGTDGTVAGQVSDLWVDRAEPHIRYLEVALAGEQERRVLLPMPFARVRKGGVHVRALQAAQFAGVPATAADDRITLQEEDRICAYYGGGTLYALPERAEPWL